MSVWDKFKKADLVKLLDHLSWRGANWDDMDDVMDMLFEVGDPWDTLLLLASTSIVSLNMLTDEKKIEKKISKAFNVLDKLRNE